jgi:hypothetical protein
MLAHERLPGLIQQRVGLVVLQQVELDVAAAGTVEERNIQRPVVRGDEVGVLVTAEVDRLDAVGLQERQ